MHYANYVVWHLKQEKLLIIVDAYNYVVGLNLLCWQNYRLQIWQE